MSDILAEKAANTITLYRGDTTKIDQFDISKTDRDALFGQGIYLTSDATVARDYSFARTYGMQSHNADEPHESQKGAIADYLQHIIRKELGWVGEKEDIVSDFRSRAWQIDRGDNYDRDIAALKQEMMDALLAAYKEKLKQAKAIYKTNAKDFVFVKSTLGQWKILKRSEWKGAITHFDVPVAYVKRCLNGEAPLSNAAIKMLTQVINDMTGEGTRYQLPGWIDFRDNDNKGTSFKDWLSLYRKEGVRYSWQGNTVGGDGTNPTLDHIMNGTLSGYHIRKDASDALIAGFQRLGYVGVEYAGGARVGGHNRGGGGWAHRAFVFWDGDFINQCMVKAEDASVDDVEPTPFKGLTPQKMMKNFRDKP